MPGNGAGRAKQAPVCEYHSLTASASLGAPQSHGEASGCTQLILIIVQERVRQDYHKISFKQVLEDALEHGSKPTKYELECSYGNPVYELPGTPSGWNNY